MKKIALFILSVIFLSGCSNITIDDPVTDLSSDVIQETTIIEEENTSIEDLSNEIDEDYGSVGALLSDDFTLEEMLYYALQDEYTARAEYEYIMSIYGVQNPFENIMASEEKHIALLLPLFETHKVEVIDDTSSDHLFTFESLVQAYEIGVVAEINNIAMYDLFLEQDNLPDDVREVFLELRNASVNHLEAFQKKVDMNT